MTEAWDVVVVGGINRDYLVRARHLPKPGQTVEGHSLDEGPGGKGANQAVAAARLGARVAFVGRIGADSRGEELVAGLAREGVDTSRVVRDAANPTGVALIAVDAQGEKQIVTAPGANRAVAREDIDGAASCLRSARVVLLQLEIPLESVLRAAEVAKEAGARVVLDAAPPVPIPDELARVLTVIRANATEASVVSGIEVTDRASAHRAAQQLRARGAEVAVVQAGEQGDLMVTDEEAIWLPRIPVRSVDATGAGDAFVAAVAVALAERRPFREAGPFASAAAALATTRVGAQNGLPRREEVTHLLAAAASGRHPA